MSNYIPDPATKIFSFEAETKAAEISDQTTAITNPRLTIDWQLLKHGQFKTLGGIFANWIMRNGIDKRDFIRAKAFTALAIAKDLDQRPAQIIAQAWRVSARQSFFTGLGVKSDDPNAWLNTLQNSSSKSLFQTNFWTADTLTKLLNNESVYIPREELAAVNILRDAVRQYGFFRQEETESNISVERLLEGIARVHNDIPDANQRIAFYENTEGKLALLDFCLMPPLAESQFSTQTEREVREPKETALSEVITTFLEFTTVKPLRKMAEDQVDRIGVHDPKRREHVVDFIDRDVSEFLSIHPELQKFYILFNSAQEEMPVNAAADAQHVACTANDFLNRLAGLKDVIPLAALGEVIGGNPENPARWVDCLDRVAFLYGVYGRQEPVPQEVNDILDKLENVNNLMYLDVLEEAAIDFMLYDLQYKAKQGVGGEESTFGRLSSDLVNHYKQELQNEQAIAFLKKHPREQWTDIVQWQQSPQKMKEFTVSEEHNELYTAQEVGEVAKAVANFEKAIRNRTKAGAEEVATAKKGKTIEQQKQIYRDMIKPKTRPQGTGHDKSQEQYEHDLGVFVDLLVNKYPDDPRLTERLLHSWGLDLWDSRTDLAWFLQKVELRLSTR